MSARGTTPEIRRVLDEARAAGFTVAENTSGHFRVIDRAGRTVATVARTPRDPRSWLNARAHIRRALREASTG
jgi:hypothetical protein